MIVVFALVAHRQDIDMSRVPYLVQRNVASAAKGNQQLTQERALDLLPAGTGPLVPRRSTALQTLSSPQDRLPPRIEASLQLRMR